LTIKRPSTEPSPRTSGVTHHPEPAAGPAAPAGSHHPKCFCGKDYAPGDELYDPPDPSESRPSTQETYIETRERKRRECHTRLDPLETPDSERLDLPFIPRIEDDRLAASFRHSGWSAYRRKVWDAFQYAEKVKPARREAFATCGTKAVIMRSLEDPETYRIACQCCHDRFCTPCQKMRARVLLANLDDALRDALRRRRVRFVTLTLKHNGATLVDQLTRLYACWRKLRSRKVWKDTQSGGAAFCEVTLSSRSGDWHPHLHVITEGSYIPKVKLQQTWLEITGDSFVVDIRAASDPHDVATYVTKYVTKGISGSVFRNQPRLSEAIDALHGRRLVITYGTWNALHLLDPTDTGDWEKLIDLATAIRHARNGVPEYIAILEYLDDQWDTLAWNPDATRQIGRDPDPPPDA